LDARNIRVEIRVVFTVRANSDLGWETSNLDDVVQAIEEKGVLSGIARPVEPSCVA
jgi:hypothetical protein